MGQIHKNALGISFAVVAVLMLFQNCAKPMQYPVAQKDQASLEALVAPEVLSIDPAVGRNNLNQDIMIFGSNFTGAKAVMVGASNCTIFSVISDEQIACSFSPEASFEGSVDIRVTNSTGTGSLLSAFEWMRPLTLAEKCAMTERVNTQLVNVAIPAQQVTCAFGQGGNNPKQSGRSAARVEQTATFNLPPGSGVCDMEFNFSNQNFQYDDHVILTYDNVVLMSSSTSHLSGLTADNGLLTYDWTKVRGLQYNNALYCLGQANQMGSCTVPGTEANGNLNLQYDGEIFHAIHALNANQLGTQHKFQLITTGDDNSGDCENTGMSFSVNVSFVDNSY